MSTRCQVKVIQEATQEGGYTQQITLYHHTDGYPDYMLPTIQKAFKVIGENWERYRAGKVASYLCSVDAGVFEPEEGHELHGDIEFYYKLYVTGPLDIGGGKNGQVWQIEILQPSRSKNFWDNPIEENMTVLEKRQNLTKTLIKKYDKKF